MSGLADFIVTESLKTRSVIALHRFDTTFKHQVTKDLAARLFSAWKVTARSLKLKVNPEQAQDATFKNPKATVDIKVNDQPTKLHSSAETGRVRLVSPSVKLPLLLTDADRGIARDAFLDAAVEQFQAIIAHWGEVFTHVTMSGETKTDFVVKRDPRSARLCLIAKSKDKQIEHETTLYHVAIEHGRIGSKVRDHDTLYLSIDR